MLLKKILLQILTQLKTFDSNKSNYGWNVEFYVEQQFQKV